MTGTDQKPFYEFGAFRLDIRNHQLLRDGEPVLLTPKAFDTLVALVQRAGQVVTKDELMKIVWPDSFVEETGLTRNISVLRKVLGSSETGGFIETVPKIGYRFSLPVMQGTDNVSTLTGSLDRTKPSRVGNNARPSWMRVAFSALAVGLALGTAVLLYYAFREDAVALTDDPKLIAVLPFKSLSSEAVDPAIRIGMADTLITRLSALRDLAVKPTSTILSFAGDDADSIAAGRELGVYAILEGSIQRDNERLRVNVRLVRVADGRTLWAERFDTSASDIFAVQDAIAEKVASAMQVRIDAHEQERLLRRYTNNVQAFDLYVRGRGLLSEYTKEATLASIEAFESSLKIEPEYALARAGLATASSEMYLRFASEAEAKEWSDRADSEIEQALEMEPDLAETHQALAAIYRKKDFNWEKVLSESSRALELNSHLDQPHFFRAAAYYHLGLLDEAAKETGLAERINPKNRVDSLRTRGVIALYSQRYADAIASFEEVQRLSSKPIADSHLAQAYFYQGDVSKAIAIARDLSGEASASASIRGRAALASFLASLGEKKEAMANLQSLLGSQYLDHHAAYSVGASYAQLGDSAKAVQWLRRSAGSGLPCYPLYQNDKLLNPLRQNAHFQEFLEQLRLDMNARRATPVK
jgi:TolB-like protein/DNA-binding winged helix-turn-helix (wHTH) protein